MSQHRNISMIPERSSMIKNHSILAIIPARGGSKGLLRKNIRPIAGKPLIAWTIEEAKKSKYIDRLILSSEDDEIIETAKKYGCEVPFVRPEELAQDTSPSIDIVLHAIENLQTNYDYICLLQPTSPLRNVKDIDGCIEMCVNKKAPSCASISEVKKHPHFMFTIGKNGFMEPIFKQFGAIRRQDLPKYYNINGAVYVNEISNILKTKQFINKKTLGYIMDSENSMDIDTEMDLSFCEFIKHKIQKKDLRNSFE